VRSNKTYCDRNQIEKLLANTPTLKFGRSTAPTKQTGVTRALIDEVVRRWPV